MKLYSGHFLTERRVRQTFVVRKSGNNIIMVVTTL